MFNILNYFYLKVKEVILYINYIIKKIDIYNTNKFILYIYIFKNKKSGDNLFSMQGNSQVSSAH